MFPLWKRGVAISATEEIAAWLHQVNGRAKSWTASPEDIYGWAKFAEDRLTSDSIPVRCRVGVEIVVKTRGPIAISYKYPVIGSSVRLRRFRDGWRLMSVSRVKRYPRQKEQVHILISSDVSTIFLKKQMARNRFVCPH